MYQNLTIMEQWKTVFEHDSRQGHQVYQVSTEGRIRNATTGVIRKYNQSGKYLYLCIKYWKDGKPYYFRDSIHRLVAKSFIPNPDGKPAVDHINGNPYDNRIENLRWVTMKENSNNPITQKHLTIARHRRSLYKKSPIVLLLEKQIPL